MLYFTRPEDALYYQRVQAFAEQVGALDEFQKKMGYLAQWGSEGANPPYTCKLFEDFYSPNCFVYCIIDGNGTTALAGGVIYSGPGLPANGSAPSWTMSLVPDAHDGTRHMWTVNS